MTDRPGDAEPGDAEPGDPGPGDPERGQVPTSPPGSPPPAGEGGRGPDRAILEAFDLGGRPVEQMTGGHINANFAVGDPPTHIVQRLNTGVFREPAAVIDNAVRIVAHLRDRGERAPAPVADRDGHYGHIDAAGGWWRVFEFLSGTESRPLATGPDDAWEAGRAFGHYLVLLDDLPGPPLADTIPRFHDLRWRLVRLDEAAASDRGGRVAGVRDVVERVRALGARVEGELRGHPAARAARVVHNDAKISNVRFDRRTGAVAAVVDLDTTMAGSPLSDVGELLRSAGTYVAEDAGDDASVAMDPTLCRAIAEGYLTGAGAALDADAVKSLPWAGPWMAVENAARFLTDHLEGDRYFHVERPDQNLDRARTQLRLCASMLAPETGLEGCFLSAGPR